MGFERVRSRIGSPEERAASRACAKRFGDSFQLVRWENMARKETITHTLVAPLAQCPRAKSPTRGHGCVVVKICDNPNMAEASRTAVVRKAIELTVIVQGFGFRPFVYRLANECNLVGFIANTSAGVSIEVQGDAEGVERFLERLPKEIPPLAKPTSFVPRVAQPQSDLAFRIIASRLDAPPRALISPDVAVCADCLREMMNPRDRRFRYPFINCTNCGPRFTIIRDIPYDRARTSMAKFKMCAACRAEYENPVSRRFHAQPNACWDCGPQMGLLAADGARMDAAEPIREAARLLQQGSVVAIKGLGGFHLACDAQN